MHSVSVSGEGPVATAIRDAHLSADCQATVVVPSFPTAAIAFADITDADFDAAWEQPMLAVIDAFQRARQAASTRIIAIVPTIGMSGALRLAPAAATAEAVRVLVKSAARQWGADGITVNCIAVSPAWFDISLDAVGTTSLAAPALGSGSVVDDLVPLLRVLTSADAHHLTGATLTADGGIWMTP